MQVWRSQTVGFGETWMRTILAAYGTRPAGALIAAPKLRLSVDPSFAPTPQSTIAELAVSEAAFSGYPAGGATPTVSTALVLSAMCVGLLVSTVFLAAADDPFLDGTPSGWWIDDGTNVVAYETFPEDDRPIFNTPGIWLDLDALLPLQLLQDTI